MSEWGGYVYYCTVVLFCAYMLKGCGSGTGRLLSTLGVLSLSLLCATEIGRIFTFLTDVVGGVSGGEYVERIGKLFGVGFLFTVCADVCSEMGEDGLSRGMISLGRVEIIALSLPMIGDLFSLADGLL